MQPSLRHRHKSGRNKGFGCGPKTRDVDPHRITNMLFLVIEIVPTSSVINQPVFSSEHLLKPVDSLRGGRGYIESIAV